MVFLFFFANAIAIGNFIRLGKVTELFGWTCFLAICVYIYYYKDKPIDWKFTAFPIVYAVLLLSHLPVIVLAQLPVLSLFLIKQKKEKLLIALSCVLGFILSSFWTVPFLFNIKEGGTLTYNLSEWLLGLKGQWLITNVFAFIIPIVFLFYFIFIGLVKKGLKKNCYFIFLY